MQKTIIFDFFGVICSEVAPRWIKKHLPNEDVEELHKSLVHEVDLGIRSPEELFQILGDRAVYSPSAVSQQWQELITINTDLVAYIKELKQKSKIGLCSNAWADFIRPILNDHGLNELFDTVTISSEVGHAKPDQEIYLIAMESLKSAPSDCVFVDDNPKNIAAAESLGMSGILFTSTAALQTQLPL